MEDPDCLSGLNQDRVGSGVRDSYQYPVEAEGRRFRLVTLKNHEREEIVGEAAVDHCAEVQPYGGSRRGDSPNPPLVRDCR